MHMLVEQQSSVEIVLDQEARDSYMGMYYSTWKKAQLALVKRCKVMSAFL